MKHLLSSADLSHDQALRILDTAAEELTAGMRVQRGELAGDLSDRLRFVHGVRIIRRQDLGEGVLHRFDPERLPCTPWIVRPAELVSPPK